MGDKVGRRVLATQVVETNSERTRGCYLACTLKGHWHGLQVYLRQGAGGGQHPQQG